MTDVATGPPDPTHPVNDTKSNNTAVVDRGEPTLELRHLHRFFGRLKAVDNVSFKAYPGQVMGYIGPNGAGKTTSMRVLATLDTPTAGDAFVCGYSVIDDPDKVRRFLGFMPDSFGKYGNMNVVEYLDFYARAYGMRGAARKDAIDHVLVFTELRKLADKSINTLSKGMSQRLGLGRCLIHDPQVLILDEPAAGLDPRARVELRELIRLLATEMNKTVLISSHILTELGEICDSAAIIEAGQILAYGTVEEIQNAQHTASGKETTRSLSVRIRDTDNLDSATNNLELWLLEQPYVTDVQSSAGRATFEFEGDEDEQVLLLKRMIEESIPVLEFHGKSQSLEDAFMNITQGITQ
jgi:ABC-2 type transport system ATP-binding protein